jgi:outer membrane protein assembly factor BamB
LKNDPRTGGGTTDSGVSVAEGDGGASDDAGVPQADRTDAGVSAGDGGTTLTCIENWPTQPNSGSKPSIEGVQPGIKWKKTVPWLAYTSDLVLTGDRIGLLAGNKLWLLDRSGNVVGDFLDATAMGSATVVADAIGNFYLATSRIVALTQDGAVRWTFEFGPSVSPLYSVGETSSTMLLSPMGVLYFAASDGYVYALQTSDGHVQWKREVGLRADGRVRWMNIGVGDAVFVEDRAYRASDGTPLGDLNVNGAAVQPLLASSSGVLAGRYVNSPDGRLENRMHMLGRCGELQWSFPDMQSWYSTLAGTDDALFVTRFDGTRFWSYWYSKTGSALKGPLPNRGVASALGADGTVYSLECDSGLLDQANMTVFAYASDLTEAWALGMGAPCNYSAAALADDGLLYLARDVSAGVEVIAIQTKSPGIASTAWPARRHDNRRTSWLGSAP